MRNLKSLDDIKKEIILCDLCKICQIGEKPVLGAGPRKAKIMFVGEAPGAEEEVCGIPFVGRAGQLLNTLMNLIGLKRDEVYITNVVKCRPPNNRTPLSREIQTCGRYLQAEISIIKPKIIVALGRTAACFLLNTRESLASLRNHIHHYESQKSIVIVTYHPAYLLRARDDKKKAIADFEFIKETLDKL